MRSLKDWKQIAYLLDGNPRQQLAHAAILATGITAVLAPFDPVLAGTVPLGIDLPESDLDILCAVYEPEHFQSTLAKSYGQLPGFTCHQKQIGGLPTTIARFDAAGFRFELFGHPRPVEEQNGYRHMVVEARLLSLAGPEASEAIRQLKREGLKTEPAFARYFDISGDPYLALLDLYHATDAALQRLVASSRH